VTDSKVNSDPSFASRFTAALLTARLGRPFEHLRTCGSTNDEVAARATAGASEGVLIIADDQTKGRGRRGRSWHSRPGENLTFSLLLRPALPARDVAPLTLLAGAALAATLSQFRFMPKLKWPNDVLLDVTGGPRKVAGILTEMSSEGDRVRHIVVGIGINVNAAAFPDDLARATSLRLALGSGLDSAALLASFLNAFEPRYDDFVADGPAAALDEWNRYALLGQPCWIDRPSGRLDGIAEGVDAFGALQIRTGGGEKISVHGGEVNWIWSR
jgi:BirA family biotin operon repressor/biotin-[acetyl-CoA-carboxylase] ligase